MVCGPCSPVGIAYALLVEALIRATPATYSFYHQFTIVVMVRIDLDCHCIRPDYLSNQASFNDGSVSGYFGPNSFPHSKQP